MREGDGVTEKEFSDRRDHRVVVIDRDGRCTRGEIDRGGHVTDPREDLNPETTIEITY